MRDGLGAVQSVVVFGAGSDIGMAIVRRLVAARTRRAVLAARTPAALDTFAVELTTAGVHTTVVPYDATTPNAAGAVLQAATGSSSDDIDLVLVTVGALGDEFDLDLGEDELRRLIDTNLTGPAAAVLSAARHLRRQGHGTIIVLSSVAGRRVRRANAPYGAAKAALDGFCVAVDAALEGTGVRVVVVRPGFVHTKMTEGRPVALFATTSDAVADRTVAAIGASPPVVWAPGVLRPVFGVLGHLPERLWRRLAER